MHTPWDTEKDEYVREWYGKISASNIADNLTRMHGNSFFDGHKFSKNAVIGRANRLGLQVPTRSPLYQKQKKQKVYEGYKLEGMRMIPLAEIGPKQCVFLVQDNICCGRDAMSHARPYCVEHWNKMRGK